MRGILAVVLMLGLPAPALAQAEHAACAPGDAALPTELAGWATRQPLTAATQASAVQGAKLDIDRGIDAALSPTREVRYAVRPEKPGGSVSYGGLFSVTVDQPGTYRVALGSAAWIDMLKGDQVITSTAHGHGPECSGVRKMVDFSLTPGRYTVQIAASGEATLPLMVARLP